MRNIIEELYYANITPCDRDIIKGGTYSHLLHLVTRNEDDLTQALTQEQQEILEQLPGQRAVQEAIPETLRRTARTHGTVPVVRKPFAVNFVLSAEPNARNRNRKQILGTAPAARKG